MLCKLLQIQVCFLDISEIISLDIFDPWLVESEDEELSDIVNSLSEKKKKGMSKWTIMLLMTYK